jgi:predicted Zn finger-like uncharacterized protein
MKFYCNQCNKPYLIADERVRGKILKIRCKNCSNVITVREGLEQAAPPPEKSGRRHSTAIAPAPLERPMTVPAVRDPNEPPRKGSPGPDADDDAMPPLDDEWYVSVDGVQDGPFSLERAREWVASRGPEDEVYCWRDSFDDWLPITDVPEFQGARRASKLALRPPPSTPSLSMVSQARVVERSASAPDPDLFGSEDEAMTRVDPRLYASAESSAPAPRPPASDTDEAPVMRLVVDDGDDAVAAEASGPDTGKLPSTYEAPIMPAMPRPAPAPAPAAQPPAARAWLSDPLSGPQPALRLPSPYPGGDGRQPMLSVAAGRGPDSTPMAPVRRGPRAPLVIVLVLALVGSGAAAYLLVRTYVRPGAGDAARALSPEDVSAELQRPGNQAALKQCYDLTRQNDPALAIDRIDVDLTVNPAGHVARVTLSQHADTPFGACLVESIQSWTFRPSAQGVTARVPLIFGR